MDRRPAQGFVQHALDRLLRERTRPLTLEVSARLTISRIDGDPGDYGLPGLQPGAGLYHALPFLEGMLDGADALPATLPFITLPQGRPAHIHLIREGDCLGVILIDASEEHDRLQDQQQLANELKLLQQRQEKLLQELNEANSAKGRFIANMSHEFRTPLTSVMGYSDLLHELTDGSPEFCEYLRAIKRNANHLLVMIDNLLDQARIDAHELTINPARTDLQTLFDDLRLLIGPLASRKHLRFRIDLHPDLPQFLVIDDLRLRQMLINLAGNAVKYTDTGEISLSADWRDGTLRVSIRDTGSGIPEALQQRIFLPFQQNTVDDYRKGAGLGLAISRELARAMGGDLQLSASSAAGSEFTLTLLADAAPSDDQAVATTGEHPSLYILIAEDDPDIQTLLAFHLDMAGHAFTLCSNGEEAIRSARKHPPDLILMDLNMPRMDGLEAARQLRREGYTGYIMAMTAEPAEGGGRDWTGTELDDYLQKPIDATQLRKAIEGLPRRITRAESYER